MFPAVYGVARVTAGVVPWYLAGGAPTPVAAYQPKGSVSLAASYVNLANPGTNNAAPGVAPTWDAVNGWVFNRSLSHYLITGVNNGPNHVVIVRVTGMIDAPTATVTPVIGAGLNAPANAFQLGNNNSSTAFVYGSGVSFQTQISGGVLALAGNDIYIDGVSIGTVSGTFTGTPLAFFIGAHNNAGTPGRFATANIQGLAIYGDDTNHATWIPAVSSAMAAL